MPRFVPTLLVLVVVGCGASSHEDRATDETSLGDHSSGDESSHGEPDAGPPRETSGDGRAAGACPASFGDRSPRCTDDDMPVSCTYPEGSCGCATPSWCGGAAPPPMPPEWICQATRPPCPDAGTPCRGSESCALDGCGFFGVRCEGGVWTSFSGPFPP